MRISSATFLSYLRSGAYLSRVDSGKPNVLVYREGFPDWFGACRLLLLGAVGLCLLLKDSTVFDRLFGSLALSAALGGFLARRRIWLDQGDGIVRISWAILIPLRTIVWDLRCFNSVAIRREEDIDENPLWTHYPVFLKSGFHTKVVLFAPYHLEVARILAAEVGRFCHLPVQEEAIPDELPNCAKHSIGEAMGSRTPADGRDLKLEIVSLPEEEREPGGTDQEVVKDSTNAFVTREPNGLVIEVVPAGVLHAGKVWIRGGSVLCFFTMLMTFLAVKKVKTDNPLLLGLILGVIWVIVLFHFAYAIHIGNIHARLTVFGDRLTIVVSGLFRSSEWHCLRSEIAVIQCGQCGKEHKGEIIMELQIFLSDGSVKRLLCGRDCLELKSIERELRQALDSPGGRSRFIRPH